MATTTEPGSPYEPREDELFIPPYPPADLRVEREKAWHEWMGIAVGLTALLSILAIIVSLVALGSSGTTVQTVTAAAPASPATAPIAPAVKTVAIGMSIKTDTEHGKRGPDGTWHDAFLPANITVHAGDKVTITFTNYDASPHTFVSPSLGVDQTVNGGGSLSSPQVVKLTFTAPKHAGNYVWWCGTPCDPWAMKHTGYMRGIVTVKA
jgi:plastocyanin